MERLPKKEYFLMRYRDAVANGNDKKAKYFLSRYKQEVSKSPKRNLEKHNVNGITIYSF